MVHICRAVLFVFSSLVHSVCVYIVNEGQSRATMDLHISLPPSAPPHTHCLLPWTSFAYRQRSHLWRAGCSLKFSPEAPDRMAADNLFIQEKKIWQQQSREKALHPLLGTVGPAGRRHCWGYVQAQLSSPETQAMGQPCSLTQQYKDQKIKGLNSVFWLLEYSLSVGKLMHHAH